MAGGAWMGIGRGLENAADVFGHYQDQKFRQKQIDDERTYRDQQLGLERQRLVIQQALQQQEQSRADRAELRATRADEREQGKTLLEGLAEPTEVDAPTADLLKRGGYSPFLKQRAPQAGIPLPMGMGTVVANLPKGQLAQPYIPPAVRVAMDRADQQRERDYMQAQNILSQIEGRTQHAQDSERMANLASERLSWQKTLHDKDDQLKSAERGRLMLAIDAQVAKELPRDPIKEFEHPDPQLEEQRRLRRQELQVQTLGAAVNGINLPDKAPFTIGKTGGLGPDPNEMDAATKAMGSAWSAYQTRK